MLKKIYPEFWSKRSFTSGILLPFSCLYIAASYLRKYFAKPIRLDAKVICVGNISVGGTGKTQVTYWLANILKQRNIELLIICKNYRGSLKKATIVNTHHSPEQVGDEAKYLSQFHPVIAANSPLECADLIASQKPEIVILDDFMQNPHIHKDFTLLVIDSMRLFGNNRILPAGPLRQLPSSAARYIDASIFIGSKHINYNVASLLSPNRAWFSAKITSKQDFDLSKQYIAFAGVGNPERFFQCLLEKGLFLSKRIIFPDHHQYSASEILDLHNQAASLNAILITTPKDAIKLNIAVLVFAPELEISSTTTERILQLLRIL